MIAPDSEKQLYVSGEATRSESAVRLNGTLNLGVCAVTTAKALFDVLGDDNQRIDGNIPEEESLATNGTEPRQHLERVTDLFGSAVLPSPPQPAFRRNGKHLTQSATVRAPRAQPTLFDFASIDPPVLERELLREESTPPPTTATAASYADSDVAALNGRSIAAIASGGKAKARDIIAAIDVLKTLEFELRIPTPAEEDLLSRFASFGPVALSLFPDPVTNRYKDAGWQELGEKLKSLLVQEEYDSAKRTTFNAFYTSPTVITAMHEAIARLGIPGNSTVLEPGCGIGNFMRLAPPGMRFIGVELDSISGRIAKALHPEQEIRIENYRDTQLPAGRIDAVIGNVLFADVKIDYQGHRLSLHDYFFAKSIGALKPKGVLALLTTHFTLDKQNAAIREYLASKADFVGAVRLPSDAFKREGTAVVTDILFLRKRATDELASHSDPEWLGVAPLVIQDAEIAVNRYFLNHREMVLGTWSRKDTLYGGEGYSVISNGNLAEQLGEVIRKLPEFAPLQVSPTEERSTQALARQPPERHIAEGSFFLDDHGRICQVIDGQAVPVVYGGNTLRAGGTQTGKRFAALIRLRDLARRVLESQNDGWPEEQRNDARSELNWAYDGFVLTYGPIDKTTMGETAEGRAIRRMPNLVKFREDPDAILVMFLEEYDDATGKAAKAAILKKDVVGKHSPITKVSSAEEELLVSLDQRGTVDVPFIAELSGKPKEKVIEELALQRLLAAADLSLISVWSPTFLTALLSLLEEPELRSEALGSGTQRAAQLHTIWRSSASLADKMHDSWPRLALISCWTDAAASQFIPGLRRYFSDVEIQPKGLLATEGFVSFPLVDQPAPCAVTSSSSRN